VIVNEYVPLGVLELVTTDIVEDDVAGFGAKLAAAPLGRPLTSKLTWSVKPPSGSIVTV
jgi:hypothetical protein